MLASFEIFWGLCTCVTMVMFPHIRRRKWLLRLLVVVFGGILFMTAIRDWCIGCRPNLLPARQNVVVKPFMTTPDDPKYDVIVSAYMNGGSRFTSRLLGYQDDSFYFYEPLWRFSLWGYFRPPDVKCSTVTGGCGPVKTDTINIYKPEGSNEMETAVKNISSDFQPTELLVNVLSRIFACDLVSLHGVVQDRVHNHINYVGPSWAEYRKCIASLHAKSECLRRLEKVCKQRKYRVIKLLRVTVGTLRPLLEINPRLKIVHLVRDPRAIMHSRKYSRYYAVGDHDIGDRTVEQNLCDKMLQDIIDWERLKETYPDRVAVLYYEDLGENLHQKVKQLYSYLNMHYIKQRVDELAEVIPNLAPPDLIPNFQKDRVRNNTKWWRKYMQADDMEKVDRTCHLLYDKLGYKKLNLQDIRGLSYPTYDIPERFKFPV